MQITNTIDILLKNAYRNDAILFESRDPQETDIFIPTSGLYEVTVVGSGGGADGGCYHKGSHHGKHYTRYQTGRGGGSGAAFKGKVYLQRGAYVITVGGIGTGAGRGGKSGNIGGNGGNATLSLKETGEVIVSANGGNGSGAISAALCHRNASWPATPGVGGIVEVSERYIFKDIEIQQNGLNGVGVSGGNSVFSGTDYGKGGNADGGSGNAGYVKLVMV